MSGKKDHAVYLAVPAAASYKERRAHDEWREKRKVPRWGELRQRTDKVVAECFLVELDDASVLADRMRILATALARLNTGR